MYIKIGLNLFNMDGFLYIGQEADVWTHGRRGGRGQFILMEAAVTVDVVIQHVYTSTVAAADQFQLFCEWLKDSRGCIRTQWNVDIADIAII